MSPVGSARPAHPADRRLSRLHGREPATPRKEPRRLIEPTVLQHEERAGIVEGKVHGVVQFSHFEASRRRRS